MSWDDNNNHPPHPHHHLHRRLEQQQQQPQQQPPLPPRRHKRYLSYASRSLVPARYRKAHLDFMGDGPWSSSSGEVEMEMEGTAAGGGGSEMVVDGGGRLSGTEERSKKEGKRSNRITHTNISCLDQTSDLKSLTMKLATQGPHKTLPTPRLIQLLFNGVYMLKTTAAIYVWEHPYYPQLYFPASVLHSYFAARSADLQISPGEHVYNPEKPQQILATQWTVTVRKKKIDKVVCFTENKENLPEKAKELAGLVRIDFASVDQWFEESTPIFVHPKDPFKRVDILQSTRHVVVKLPLGDNNATNSSEDAAKASERAASTGIGPTATADDEEQNYRIIADTFSSMHLYETGLPCRFYIPLTRVDASVLRKSSTKTSCPYKGEASYYDVILPASAASTTTSSAQKEEQEAKETENENEIIFKDIAWYYPTPLLESAKISDLLCFYNEKVRIEVDGEILPRPVTPFSTGGAGGEDKNKLSSLPEDSGTKVKRERDEEHDAAGGGEEEEVLNMGSLGTPLGPLKEEKGVEG
ncbi:hypothetical protein BST61_g9796 [Cercospora zeina]